jgi:hypothetical protein
MLLHKKYPKRFHTSKKENNANDIAERRSFVGATTVLHKDEYASPVSNGFIPDSFLTTLIWKHTLYLFST